MSACVYFRFKSEKEKCPVPIDGHEISVRQLRDKISDIKKLRDDPTIKKKGPNPGYNLVLLNSQNNLEYKDENTLIPAGTFLIVKRVLRAQPTTIPVYETTGIEEHKPAPIAPTPVNDEISIYEMLGKMINNGQLPVVLACTVCDSLLIEPSITACCGFTGCRECIGGVCPSCNKGSDVFPDSMLHDFIQNVMPYITITLNKKKVGKVPEEDAKVISRPEVASKKERSRSRSGSLDRLNDHKKKSRKSPSPKRSKHYR
jgi:hypothetical protein